ncbi:MAG TPA: hypothetical protein VHW93_08825, partial [Acidimicrobiales bacterium]|nr:hypothetical protein [Acidimicrobiales bacterium]
RAGGLGERLGVLLAPFNLCSVVLAYIAAIVIDATGNYRLIWLFPAATGLAHATVNCWLKYPARRATSPDMVGRLWEWSVVQAESMAEMGLVTGLLAAPVLGVVTKEDADSAVVIDMARNILGNPYDPVGPDGDQPAPGQGESPAQSPSDEGSDRLVTGVRQVGGGPEDGRANGDQKSGRGGSSVVGDDASEPDGSDGSSPNGQAEALSAVEGPTDPEAGSDSTSVPNGGVASTMPRTRSTPTGAESKNPEPEPEPPAEDPGTSPGSDGAAG